MSAKLDQERPKLDHVGTKRATWSSTWGLLGRFGDDFCLILRPCLDIGDLWKSMKNLRFLKVFWYSEVVGVAC